MILVSLLLSSLSSLSGLGAEPAAQMTELESRESWYWGFSLGYPALSYTGDTQDTSHRLRVDPTTSRVPFAVDLGAYWPLSVRHETLLGVSLRMVVDHYGVGGGDSVDIAQQLLGVSGIVYTGPRLARGLFVRGDLGLAVSTLSDSSGFSRDSEPGVGGFAGFGYALPVGAGSRLLFQAGYGLNWIESQAFQAASVSVGALF